VDEHPYPRSASAPAGSGPPPGGPFSLSTRINLPINLFIH
jgi:hypothetical protein